MSNFDIAFLTIKEQEGGYVNDPNDIGGPTNCGISLRWYRTIYPDATIKNIEKLAIDEIAFLYRTYWWNINRYFLIDAQTVATKVFSLAVNQGATQAHKLLQRACWSVNGRGSLVDDGVLGPVTFGAVNKILSSTLLAALRSEAAGFYRTVVAKNPQDVDYLDGWLKRAYS